MNSWGSCKYKPDLLNVHAYAADIDGLKSTVGKYHDQFNLPIILSEFACHVSHSVVAGDTLLTSCRCSRRATLRASPRHRRRPTRS